MARSTKPVWYKHNNRSYESSGVEVNFDIDLNNHQLALGMRAHGDEMDRFQPQDLYDPVDGSPSYVSTIAPTGSNNRFEEADATSFWATDDWQLSDRLNVNLMLRFEDVETSRRQFADTARATAPSTRSNNTSLWLPGASLGYQLNDNVLVSPVLTKASRRWVVVPSPMKNLKQATTTKRVYVIPAHGLRKPSLF